MWRSVCGEHLIPAKSGLPAFLAHDFLHPPPGQRPSVVRQEKKIAFGPGRHGAAVVDVVPEQALHLLADRNHALLVAFTQDFQHAVIELYISELQSEEFGDPQPGIEQGQDDRVVALPLGVAGIHGIEQQLDLRGRERRHDFFRYFGDFNPFKRVRRDDFF